MSVVEGKRGEKQLQLFIKSKELAVYTTKICVNKKVFVPDYQDAMTAKLIDLAQTIFIKLWKANNIIVSNSASYHRRMDLQRESYEHCNELLAMIEMAKPIYHLESRRIKHWGGQVLEVRRLLVGWHEKDSKRYQSYDE